MLQETQIKSMARELAYEGGQNYDTLPVQSQDIYNNKVLNVIQNHR